VRNVAKKTINSSTRLLPKWKEVVSDCNLAKRHILRDVKTRWNSTYDMIAFVLEYRRAYKQFTTDESNGLTDYILSSAEWTVLDDLRDILHDATLYFSRDSATLATVIPAMDKIDEMLATAVLKRPAGDKKGDKTFSLPVTAALLKAKYTLNRYYAMTAKTRVYLIALSTCL
ncbi:hypothetical protein C8F01DRAFT_1001073, partial [Mycena amicta]